MRELGRLIDAEQSGKSISPPGAITLHPLLIVRESSLPKTIIKTTGVV
jgi:hypothetical protein